MQKVFNASVFIDGPRRMGPGPRAQLRTRPGRRRRMLIHIRDLAAPFARVLLFISRPLQTEGAGKAGCALHPRSRVRFAQNKVHTSIQVQRRTPGLPCAMALRLIRDRPGDPAFCDTIAGLRLSPLANLTPASGRRTQTISPYARTALVSRSLRVHRSLSLVCDDGRRPSGGTGWRELWS